MIFNDAIHVQAKGGEDSNVEGISTSEADDWFANSLRCTKILSHVILFCLFYLVFFTM